MGKRRPASPRRRDGLGRGHASTVEHLHRGQFGNGGLGGLQQALQPLGATTLNDLQAAEATLASAAARIDHLKAQIEQTQASLKADEARLGYTRIYAPMAGTVVSVEAREGQTLNATYQTPNILRIADIVHSFGQGNFTARVPVEGGKTLRTLAERDSAAGASHPTV